MAAEEPPQIDSFPTVRSGSPQAPPGSRLIPNRSRYSSLTSCGTANQSRYFLSTSPVPSLNTSIGISCFSAIVRVWSGSSGLTAIRSAPKDRICGSALARAASSRLQYGHHSPR
jgi:hypothetical protein